MRIANHLASLEVTETWGEHSDLCEAWFAEGASWGADRPRRRIGMWTQLTLAMRDALAPARRALAR